MRNWRYVGHNSPGFSCRRRSRRARLLVNQFFRLALKPARVGVALDERWPRLGLFHNSGNDKTASNNVRINEFPTSPGCSGAEAPSLVRHQALAAIRLSANGLPVALAFLPFALFAHSTWCLQCRQLGAG